MPWQKSRKMEEFMEISEKITGNYRTISGISV
jgi:hypothetical protein